MMPPYVYEEARATAPMHVQLWQFNGMDRWRGDASVLASGWVVRIFRDADRALHLGKRVTFRVPVISMHQSGDRTPSGDISHDWSRMGRAHWLEAFLQCSDGEFELVLSQIVAIRHPTMRPVCGPDDKGFLASGNFE
jgi:hypothetical protein